MIGFLGLLLVLPGRSQTFAEWFQQNSTRLKYYAEQIAALQVYLGEMKKWYDISDVGLTAITGSKQGEFKLHQDYYTSLDEINPSVALLQEVAEIGALQAAIIQRFSTALARYRNDGLMGTERVAYLGAVYANILQAGLSDVEMLTAVLTTDHWQMTDDERMARIIALDTSMKDRYSFTLAFTDGADLMERQQSVDNADIMTVMGLYGIP